MPIYEYQCGDCGHRMEALQKISAAPLTGCPACHSEGLVKLVSASSFRLKGGGWYETDFKTGAKRHGTQDSGTHDSGAQVGAETAGPAAGAEAGSAKGAAAETASTKTEAAPVASSGNGSASSNKGNKSLPV